MCQREKARERACERATIFAWCLCPHIQHLRQTNTLVDMLHANTLVTNIFLLICQYTTELMKHVNGLRQNLPETQELRSSCPGEGTSLPGASISVPDAPPAMPTQLATCSKASEPERVIKELHQAWLICSGVSLVFEFLKLKEFRARSCITTS
jgi:hypothetical protein